MSNLVFGVGLPLTNEEQLAEFIKERGYRPRTGASWGWAAAMDYLKRGDTRILVDCLRDGHDSWLGWPFACYQKLWDRYRDAKYVVTVCGDSTEWRDRWAAWQASFGKDPAAELQRPLVEATLAHVFGESRPSLAHAVDVYERHNAAAEGFLKEHGANFVVLNLASRRAGRALNRFVPQKQGPPQ